MDTLWAPWRMEYINSEKDMKCIFCVKPQQKEDKKNLILYRGKRVFILMNLYPYNSGHIMISPYSHVSSLSKLDKESLQDMALITQKSVKVIEELFKPEGMNVGMNIGKTAGAGFDEHIHTHIVPRWNGDTNFMPVLSKTKVIPEHIADTYEKMAPFFNFEG